MVNLNRQHMVNLNRHRVVSLTEYYTISYTLIYTLITPSRISIKTLSYCPSESLTPSCAPSLICSSKWKPGGIGSVVMKQLWFSSISKRGSGEPFFSVSLRIIGMPVPHLQSFKSLTNKKSFYLVVSKLKVLFIQLAVNELLRKITKDLRSIHKPFVKFNEPIVNQWWSFPLKDVFRSLPYLTPSFTPSLHPRE